MFGLAIRRARGASRIQARSLSRPSSRNARHVMACAARGGYEKGSNGSQQSNNSSGHGRRHNSRLPLRATAVGASMLAGAATSDDSATSPTYAFRDPSGWDYWHSDPSTYLDLYMRISQAIVDNSIEEARKCQFDYTRVFLKFCLRGELIDEGPLPDDVIFGLGQCVRKEDTRVFWMPSPEPGKSSVLCLSVYDDLKGDDRELRFLECAIGPQMCRRLLEKFKDDGGTRVFVHVDFPAGFFCIGISREQLVNVIEREEAMSDKLE